MLVVVSISCGKSRYAYTWTFLVYMDGDNDLGPAALRDATEMKTIGSSDMVNIIVQIDLPGGVTAKRYRIIKNGWERLSDLGELDMASPQTITDFLVWAKDAYPAERTVLVLWNHGNGWDQGDGPSKPSSETSTSPLAVSNSGPNRSVEAFRVRSSEVRDRIAEFGVRSAEKIRTSENPESAIQRRSILYDDDNGLGGKSLFLSNHKVKQAIQASGIQLDLLGLDASIMGTIEALYEFKDLAPIIVSSQEVGEAHGWDYTAIISSLVANPGMSVDALSRVIVDSYRNFLENVFYPSQPVYEKRHTIAAFRMAYLGLLAEEIDALAGNLINRINDPAMMDATLTLISTARMSVQEIDKYVQPYVYVDLVDLDRLLNQGTQINSLISSATIAEYHGSARPNAHGISIVFFPSRTSLTYDSNYKNYDTATNTGNGGDFINQYRWDEFLAAYYQAAGL